MKGINENEIGFILALLKNPKTEFNGATIAKEIGMTSMGALKIARKLQKEGLVDSRTLGHAKYYSLNQQSAYAKSLFIFLLKMEAESAKPFVKIWINELRKVKNADCVILFGSVLTKQKAANDIDALFITDNHRYSVLKKEIEDINLVNKKKLHPIFQSSEDFRKNIHKSDKIVINSIKGIVVFGEEHLLNLLII